MGGRGARSAVKKQIIRHGTRGTVSRAAASNALRRGFYVNAAGKRRLRFTRDLHDKYANGVGRKDNQPAKERLYQLGKAVTATKKANRGVYRLLHDHPPQIAFLHRFSKRDGMVVFVDLKTRTVRGFINVDSISKWEKSIQERTKRLPVR